MADLLTHVLLVYVLLTVLSWRSEHVRVRDVPVAMVGAIIPDLSRIWLLIPIDDIDAALGVPFTFAAVHRLGATLALVTFGALLFPPRIRRRAFGFLLVGAVSQYPLDGLLVRADGLTPPYLYPFSWWQAPAGNLYLSSDLWIVLPVIGLAVAVWGIDRLVMAEQIGSDAMAQPTSER